MSPMLPSLQRLATELEKDNAEIWSGLGHAYALSGKRAEAQKVLDHLKELSAHSWVAPYNVAVIYVGLGEKDQAFALLDRPTKIGPTICLIICRRTRVWTAFAPTRALVNSGGASDFQSDASCPLLPSAGSGLKSR